MSSTHFRFKQFTVHHDKCAMKVGTDAILLGAWAKADGAQNVLDIGTGSGVIALMLAQRCPNAKVTAVEVERAASEQAAENFAASPWSDRLSVTCGAIQEFVAASKFDLIVCNPPFFVDGIQPADAARKLARHSDALLPADLVATVQRHLQPDGRFSVVLPVQQAIGFLKVAEAGRLYCRRLCDVLPTPTSTPRRQLLEFAMEPTHEELQRQEIVLEVSRHEYADDYCKLAGNFLLRIPGSDDLATQP